MQSVAVAPTLVACFLLGIDDLESYNNDNPAIVNGTTLSIAMLTAVARYHARVRIDESPELKERIVKGRAAIVSTLQARISLYGVNTGFGGSAVTRTDDSSALGNAFLEHHFVGVLPLSTQPTSVLPLVDPLASTSMPESWVRGAILTRMNCLIRGHSGVRWELVEKLGELLQENIIPVVPLRTSISASGDLSPLSYVAAVLLGNPAIRVFDGPARFGPRQLVSTHEAFRAHGVTPFVFEDKEYLSIANGTAFSAATAALALHEAVHLTLLSHVLTALCVEALGGVRGSFHPFIHNTARPHPGQIESAHIIWDLLEGSAFALPNQEGRSIDEDNRVLRQDRYPLRTAAQFLGPQVEDILHACEAVTIELNSTTDNPLFDVQSGEVHHCGNFQAMAVSNAMEKTRLALHHIGKILFAQSTELLNPAMNGGLPPNAAATDPSLNFHAKGIDIATAAYVSELGYLANPVTTHIQSAEMHNQSVNSLALISARATINSVEVLSMLMASYLYVLCQALDLRTLQHDFYDCLNNIITEEYQNTFALFAADSDGDNTSKKVWMAMRETLVSTSTMDSDQRIHKMCESSSPVFLEALQKRRHLDVGDSTDDEDNERARVCGALDSVQTFKARVAERARALLQGLRTAYLTGAKGPTPAGRFLGRTRPIYEYVRVRLGVKMHGLGSHVKWEKGLGLDEALIGDNISRIFEAMRDGEMQGVLAKMMRTG